MRIINRVVTTWETKDKVVTRVTERIVENEQYQLMPLMGPPKPTPSPVKVQCNICTEKFTYDHTGNGRCPHCGSIDVGLV